MFGIYRTTKAGAQRAHSIGRGAWTEMNKLLTELLPKHVARRGTDLTLLSGYEAHFWDRKTWAGELGIGRESSFAIMLTFNSQPICCVGFNLRDNAVVIVQLQGVVRATEDLRRIWWVDVLLSLVYEIARSRSWCEYVSIRSAKISPWYLKPCVIGLKAERRAEKRRIRARMIERYNETAVRHGYRWNWLTLSWIKEVRRVDA